MACGAPLAVSPPISEERKVVTTLFCDLVSFTAMSEASDPEDVDRLLNDYFARATRVIEAHGGTVEKFIGDAVVGVFGVPAVHEDDPERAVRAGLRILEVLEGMTRPDGSPLHVRVGINTGEALVRLDVEPASGLGFLTGDAVNSAARLETAAPPGGVAVGALTHDLTERVIVYEELPAVSAKGKAEPVAAWLASGTLARRGLDARSAELSPLIGREMEFGYLSALFEKVVSQSMPQFALIVGEPGIGKSRLVRELSALVDARSEMVTWRQGYCPPFGDELAFAALVEIVKGHAGIRDSDAVDVVESKLEAISQEGSDRAWIYQRLRALLGLSASEASRGENFTAWMRFFEGLATVEPIALVLEDLHWADEGLLDFLEFLATQVAGVPLLLVGTARPELFERRPGFMSAAPVTRINLAPLSTSETSQLVAGLLGEPDDFAAAVGQVVARCEGNPFFAEQSARLLADTSLHAPLPESVQAVIAARLDALPLPEKRLLADASVVGDVFWQGALQALSDPAPDGLEQSLAGLLQHQLIRRIFESSMEGEQEFAFVHGLAREVAYGQLPRAARASKHAATAGWLERKTGDRIEEQADRIAYHYSRAVELAAAAGRPELVDKLREPAINYLTIAGERALAVDIPAAERACGAALALVHDKPPSTRLLSVQAIVLSATGRPREAERVWREVIERLEAEGEVREAAHATEALWDVLERLDEPRRDLSTKALDLLAHDGPSPDLVMVLADYAFAGSLTDSLSRQESREGLDRAVEMAAELGLPTPAKVLGFRGAVRCAMGDLEGLRDFECAIEAGTQQGLGYDLMEMYLNYASALLVTRGPGASLEATSRGLDAARRRGDEASLLMFRHQLVWAMSWLGDWDAALREADSLEPEVLAADDRWTLCALRMDQALLSTARGMPAIVLPFLDWLTDRGRVTEAGYLAGALTAAAAVRLGLGQAETALGLVKEVAERRADYWDFLGHVLVRTAIEAGDPGLAARLTDAVTRDIPLMQHVQCTCRALVEEASGEKHVAVAAFVEAAARWHAFGVPYEEAQALLGHGRCLVALDRAQEAAQPLEQAREIFERLGAKPALTETDEWLEKALLS